MCMSVVERGSHVEVINMAARWHQNAEISKVGTQHHQQNKGHPRFTGSSPLVPIAAI